MRPSGFSECLGVPCRISPGHGCAAAEITSTFARVLAHPGSGCSRVALLARLACPDFAQFADHGQRRVVVQVKREWFGLDLLGGGFRVHVYGVLALRLEERVRCRWCAGPQKRKAPAVLNLGGFTAEASRAGFRL